MPCGGAERTWPALPIARWNADRVTGGKKLGASTIRSVTRVLDVDLDFFVHGAAHWRGREHGRLPGDEYPPWPVEEAVNFLVQRCRLRGSLPGFVVENDGDLFPLWRSAIKKKELEAPFHLTHVDAHADLGLGDSGYVHLMSDVLFRPVEERDDANAGVGGLGDGNWLAFALACRWISDLVYVFNEEVATTSCTFTWKPMTAKPHTSSSRRWLLMS